MAASLSKTNYIQASLVSLYFFILAARCRKETNYTTTRSPGIAFQQESAFTELLQELHGHETQLHRCTFMANYTVCLHSAADTQTHFSFPLVGKVLDSQCSSDDIYDCMKTDTFVDQLVNVIRSDIEKTVEDVCCTLGHCMLDGDDKEGRQTASTSTGRISNQQYTSPLISGENWQEICFKCAVLLEGKMADDGHLSRLKILQNMTCTQKTFNNFSCKELNIIAINILSVNASKKLQNDAKDMIKNCNPGFYNDPIRTFSAMMQAPSEAQLLQLGGIFVISEESTTTHKTPGKVFGIIILVAVVIISLFVLGWLIRTRIVNNRTIPSTSPNVLYSRIDYNDEALDDYSNDEDGEQRMFE